MLNSIIKNVNYFKNKNINLGPCIYLNDKNPCCFLVECEQQYYKVRLPSQFNPNAITCEIKALQMLHPILNNMIPALLESNNSSDNSYIVENFFPGKSLDKMSNFELIQSATNIIEQLYLFLESTYTITSEGFGELTSPSYRTYKTWLLYKLTKQIMFHKQTQFIPKNILNKIFMMFNETAVFDRVSSHFLHFDIKPQNLIYDSKSQRLFVIDFEFSRFGDIEHELYRAEKRSSQYPVFLNHIWFPVLQQYLHSKQIILSSEKQYLFSIYYYLSELTYLLKSEEFLKASAYLELLKERLSAAS